MHFPVYVVLPRSIESPSRKQVEKYVETTLAPHQYIERNRPGVEEPEVLQHGWWDWYSIGGNFQDPSHEKQGGGLKGLFRTEPAKVGPISDLLAKWSPEWVPTRIVTPDGAVHGGIVLSEDEQDRWSDDAKQILTGYAANLFVVVDCHK